MKSKFVLGLLCLIVSFFSASAVAFDVGDRVVLRPTNPLGVPLHEEARSSMFGRGADGTVGTVVDTANDERWLRVELANRVTAWMLAKYVEAAADLPPEESPSPGLSGAAPSIFGSRDSCEQAVIAGERMGPSSPDRLRIATWNIRWFPIGDPQRPGKETDLTWLACVLAWLNTDVVALQEILDTREADFAWASVTDGIEGFVGGDWQIDLHACAGERAQHVGFLWNAERVALSDGSDRWRLNGAAEHENEPCAGNLRPGRDAFARALPSGADFHIIVVHSDSGTSARDFDHRQAALERFDELFSALQAETDDTDVIILGDFNTMGADDRMDAEQEIQALEQKIGSESPGFRLIKPSLRCTEYFKGDCGWLDHITISRAMDEAGSDGSVVTGYCAESAGERLDPDNMPAAYRSLSDHCPVVMELRNADLD